LPRLCGDQGNACEEQHKDADFFHSAKHITPEVLF
jgi:hypothetical protein